jgi:hypothetical protein
MKSRIHCLLKLISLNLVFIFVAHATDVKSHNVSYSLMSAPLSCEVADASTKKFTLQSKILLNKNFFSKDMGNKELDQLIDDSIERQVKHLMGYFKNTKNAGMNGALFSYRNLLEKSKPIEVAYGAEIIIDKYLPADRGDAWTPYLKLAIDRGQTKADDRALEVSYKIELLLSDCSPNGFVAKNNAVLPLDPYLSLWLEKKEQRVAREMGPYKLAQASNCSSYEIAIFGNGESNWFFWNPIDPINNKNCKIEGQNKVITPVISDVSSVTAPPRLTKDFFPKNEVIKFSAIFGEILNEAAYFTPHVYANLRKQITENFSGCLKSKIIPECLGLWNSLIKEQTDKKFYEPGTHSFLVFLKFIPTLVKISSFEIPKDKNSDKDMVIKIKGKLTDSLKPIEIDVYLGRTILDYGEPATKIYTQFTHNAFKNADSISYVGHAGLGRNVNIDDLQKLWTRDRLADFSRKDPLWLGLYNCEGVSHFGFDLDKIFKANKVKSLQTFTSGVMSGPDFPLYQLMILNRVFSNEAVKVSDVIKNEFATKEFLNETWLSEK